MRKVWQYHVLMAIKNRHEGNSIISRIVNKMFQKYINGFVIDGKRRISNLIDVAKYIVRYVRHPAIADSPILNHDGKQVEFSYKRRIIGKIHYYKKIMEIDEFIEALMHFIPPKNFKLFDIMVYIREEVK